MNDSPSDQRRLGQAAYFLQLLLALIVVLSLFEFVGNALARLLYILVLIPMAGMQLYLAWQRFQNNGRRVDSAVLYYLLILAAFVTIPFLFLTS